VSGDQRGHTVSCHRCQKRLPLRLTVRALDADWCHDCCAMKISEVESLKKDLQFARERIEVQLARERKRTGSKKD